MNVREPLALMRRDELLSDGTGWRALAASVSSGDLVAVRPGVFAFGADWRRQRSEQEAVTRAHAYALMARHEPVFSGPSAAALHGLPLFRVPADNVHVLAGDMRAGAARGVVRHDGPSVDDDVVEVGGLRCTSLARTLADLARSASEETTVAAADAALHRYVDRNEYDEDAAASLIDAARGHLGGFARRVDVAHRALEFADGRAQLPGESVSRVYFHRLGFPIPRLQVPVPGPKGTPYAVDFGFEGMRLFGEFDGEAKYTDPEFLQGRTAQQAIMDEKRREDWIRATTGWQLVRWMMPNLQSTSVFGSLLRGMGVRPPA
jgi:hypothetical protein